LLDLFFFTAPQEKSHLLIAIHPLSFPFFFTFHPDCLGLHAPNKKIQKGKRERRASIGKICRILFLKLSFLLFLSFAATISDQNLYQSEPKPRPGHSDS
jgi:hypothetical protein